MSYTTNPVSNRLGFSHGWKNILLPQNTNIDTYQSLYLKSYLVFNEFLKFYQMEVSSFEIKNLQNYKKIIHIFIYNPLPYKRKHETPIFEFFKTDEKHLGKIFRFTFRQKYKFNPLKSKKLIKKQTRMTAIKNKRRSSAFVRSFFIENFLDMAVLNQQTKFNSRFIKNYNRLEGFKNLINWPKFQNRKSHLNPDFKKRKYQWLRKRFYSRLRYFYKNIDNVKSFENNLAFTDLGQTSVNPKLSLLLLAWRKLMFYFFQLKSFKRPGFKRISSMKYLKLKNKLLITEINNNSYNWNLLSQQAQVKSKAAMVKNLTKRFLSQIKNKRRGFLKARTGRILENVKTAMKKFKRRPFQDLFGIKKLRFKKKRKIRRKKFKLTRSNVKLWRRANMKKNRKLKLNLLDKNNKIYDNWYQNIMNKLDHKEAGSIELDERLLGNLKRIHQTTRYNKNWYLRRRFSNKRYFLSGQRWKLFKTRKNLRRIQKSPWYSELKVILNKLSKTSLGSGKSVTQHSQEVESGLLKPLFCRNDLRARVKSERHNAYLEKRFSMLTPKNVLSTLRKQRRRQFRSLKQFMPKRRKTISRFSKQPEKQISFSVARNSKLFKNVYLLSAYNYIDVSKKIKINSKSRMRWKRKQAVKVRFLSRLSKKTFVPRTAFTKRFYFKNKIPTLKQMKTPVRKRRRKWRRKFVSRKNKIVGKLHNNKSTISLGHNVNVAKYSSFKFRKRHSKKLKAYKYLFPSASRLFRNLNRQKKQIKERRIFKRHNKIQNRKYKNQKFNDLEENFEKYGNDSTEIQTVKIKKAIKQNLTKQYIYQKVVMKKMCFFFESYLKQQFNLSVIVKMTLPYSTIYVPTSKLLRKLRFNMLLRRFSSWKFFDRLILLFLYNSKSFSNVQMLADLIAYEMSAEKKKPKQIINVINDLFYVIKPSYIKTFKLVLTGKTKGRASRLRGRKNIIKRQGREMIPAQTFETRIAYAIGIAKTNKGLYSVKLWLQYS